MADKQEPRITVMLPPEDVDTLREFMEYTQELYERRFREACQYFKERMRDDGD